jgi:hypothetical protein
MRRRKGRGYFLVDRLTPRMLKKPLVPRIRRGQQGGYAYHIINRGNGRATIFHKPQGNEVSAG